MIHYLKNNPGIFFLVSGLLGFVVTLLSSDAAIEAFGLRRLWLLVFLLVFVTGLHGMEERGLR